MRQRAGVYPPSGPGRGVKMAGARRGTWNVHWWL